MNATRRPSGEMIGDAYPAPSVVSRRRPEPSAFMTMISPYRLESLVKMMTFRRTVSTRTCAVPAAAANVARTVVDPFATAVTRPVALTVAIDGSTVDQVTGA